MRNVKDGVLVDSHCHLDLQEFDADREAVIDRARSAGIAAIVNPGIDLQQCRRAMALAGTVDELFVAVGIHPNSADQYADTTLDEVRSLAAHPKVVAIGEIGLDFYWKKVAPDVQHAAFVGQLHLAAELGVPVLIHSREANDAVADVLKTWVASRTFRNSPLAKRPYAGVLHAFSGDRALAEAAYEWNFVLGMGGPVTFRNAHALRELIPALRLDRLMLETDAPYLTPHPHRGTRNEPAMVALVCEQVAQLRGLAPAEVAAQTSATAFRFYGLEERTGVDSSARRVAVGL